jgi:hypothetical protein
MRRHGIMVWMVLAVMFVLSTGSTGIATASQPIQLALFTPIQIVPANESVGVVRLNLIYSKNQSVTGLDWGLVNHSGSGAGVGLALGFVNYNEGSYQGLQWGAVNYTDSMQGLQLGFVNYSKRLNGVQVGFLNFIEKGGLLPIFPFFNFSF